VVPECLESRATHEVCALNRAKRAQSGSPVAAGTMLLDGPTIEDSTHLVERRDLVCAYVRAEHGAVRERMKSGERAARVTGDQPCGGGKHPCAVALSGSSEAERIV